MKTIVHYQQDGFVKGFDSKALAETNRQIAVAKNSTPEHYRNQMRSQIRSSKQYGGYCWYWVVK